jgi:excisionase family DNA binding protein
VIVDYDELLFLEEVAERCRAPLSSVRHWVRTRKLPSIRPGRRRMVRRSDLERFLQAQSAAVSDS